MDKETVFAEEVVAMAKDRGINLCLFLAREDNTFHYRVYSSSTNTLVTAVMKHLNDLFGSLVKKRG